MFLRKAISFSALCVVATLFGVTTNGCSSDEACECIRSYGNANMSSADITRLIQDGIKTCFNVNDPETLQDQSSCLPVDVGTDARNGKPIALNYSCSDVCPDAGGVSIAYRGVSEADCCAAGGVKALDFAWGGYVGCLPPEVGWEKTKPCP